MLFARRNHSDKYLHCWIFSHICLYDCKSKKDFQTLLETGAKKTKLAQELTIKKNPYFLSDQADILVILPTLELSTLTKFH